MLGLECMAFVISFEVAMRYLSSGSGLRSIDIKPESRVRTFTNRWIFGASAYYCDMQISGLTLERDLSSIQVDSNGCGTIMGKHRRFLLPR